MNAVRRAKYMLLREDFLVLPYLSDGLIIQYACSQEYGRTECC